MTVVPPGLTADAMPGAQDTIAAVATAPGRGAIAIVRVSGARAHEIMARVLEPWPLVERRATLCTILDPRTGALLDRGLVTVFHAGRSFTGEPSVEVATHGGLLVPATVLGAVVAAGAREALPGEFTRRAVLHGRMDLIQAEALGDLIDATSTATHRSALRQLDGALSARITALREAILQIEALIAYDIDFPDEDDGPVPAARVRAACDDALASLDALLETAKVGTLIRNGALAVLAGAPNVGKSSLFNALLGEGRALVTEVPGTTRDAIEVVIDTGRWPVRLVDTAGLRVTTDVVERLGVEVSRRYLAAADVVLACADDVTTLESTVARIRAESRAPVVAVATKRDLMGTAEDVPAIPGAAASVGVSARTGTGLGTLIQAIDGMLDRSAGGRSVDIPMLTRERHREAIVTAREEVLAFVQAWTGGDVPAVIAAVHLRSATTALEELIGAVDVEQVLDRVFASFCIGK